MKIAAVFKFLIGLTLGLLLAALVAFNVLLVWVATGPRSLEKFTPYIEQALVGESGVHAKIGQTWLLWGGWQHPVDIHLKDVALFTKEGMKFSAFPDISLGVDVLALPFGQVLPTSLSVTKPIISIKQNPDKSLTFGGDAPVSSPPDENIASTGETLQALVESLVNPRSKSSLRKLRTIELLNADVSIGNDVNGVVLSAPDTTFIVRKESGARINAQIRTVIKYKEYESVINAQGAYNKITKRLEGTASASKLYPAILSELLFDNPIMSAVQFPVSGRIGFAVSDNGAVDALQFAIDGGRGKIVHERVDGALPVNNLKIVGRATNGLKNITIDEAKIDFSGSLMSAAIGIVRSEKGLGLTGQASITDVDIDQAHMFWPLGLAPLSREWVTSNIRDGGITKASVKFNIKSGDLDLPLLPKEAVDAQIDLKDAKIHYLAGHPETRGVNAVIKVDGLSLDAAISHAAAFTDTVLTNGRVYIADLNPDNPLIELSMHADAPASDIVTLLGLPMLEHAKHLNLDAKKATGRATGDAKLGFYFFAKDNDGKDLPLTYDIKAKLDKVGSPAFLGRFDIADANGEMAINEKEIAFSGSSNVNGAAISKGDVRYSFEAEKGIDTTIDATVTVNDAALKKFGVQLPIVIRDLPNVTMHAALSTQKDATAIPNFSLKGEGVDLAGSAVLTPDGKDMATLALDHLVYDKTKLSALQYISAGDSYSLRMAGAALDASQLFEKKKDDKKTDEPKPEGQKPDGFSFEHFPAMDLNIDVATLYGAQEAALQELKLHISCSVQRCDNVEANGKSNQKPFIFKIHPEGRNRKLSASSNDAGGLLRAIGVIDSMEGGALSLSGQFDDVKGGGLLRGTFNVTDYTLKNAPVLARMLSLASITGFLDTLSGNGIAFKKLVVPFTLQNDVITVKDGRAFGSAMGLTADGTITFPASQLKLEGTIVPSYTLNNVVGKVPLLGNILMGGEGQGVFAANYSMKGNTDDPSVTVNPLSILTPGFLRHLFDVF